MKKTMILVAALVVALPAFADAPSVTLAQADGKNKLSSGFDGLDAAGIGRGYQSPAPLDHSVFDKIVNTPSPPKPALGMIDKWRYESCQQDAATTPTQSGINIKMRVCREKFGQ